MSAKDTNAPRELTGRHVFIITASAFALIIGVNLTMAFKAVSTFPGLEVKNSYVASQSFEARRDAQEALGWTVAAGIEGKRLSIQLADRDGAPVAPASLTVLLGRSTNATDDQIPDMEFDGTGFVGQVAVSRGLWTLKIAATDGDGTIFEKRVVVQVK
jgi:nitrogen fixation protein FixH